MTPGESHRSRLEEVAMSFRAGQVARMVAVLLAMPILTGGCATVFQGTRQKIEILTDPPGATATAADQQITTPGVLKLPRKGFNSEIRIEKEGFTPKTVRLERRPSNLVWLNLIGIPAGIVAGAVGGASSSSDGWEALGNAAEGALAGGLALPTLGFWTDFQTGAAYRLEPARIVVRLEPVSSAVSQEHGEMSALSRGKPEKPEEFPKTPAARQRDSAGIEKGDRHER